MELKQFFEEHSKVAIALSGGIDSVFLMHMAKKYGAEVCAYFAKTEFQPGFELADAEEQAKRAGVPLYVMSFSILEDEKVAENDSKRCYHCKKGIMQLIRAMSQSDGFDVLCDGTNASDSAEDRPGCRALCELSVVSPLKICGISKSEVRKLAKEEGVSLWDKPSYACLATRIQCGERITKEKLDAVDSCEAFLRTLGFSDFRVRVSGKTAKIEVCSEDMGVLFKNREKIVLEMKKYFDSVCLNMEARNEKFSG